MSCGRGVPIVVFGSGRGSNFRALAECARSGTLAANIAAVVTNVKHAGIAEIAREYNVPVLEIPHSGLEREAHEEAVINSLKVFKHEWIVLAGYMRLFTPKFIARYFDQTLGCTRIVNIHPSLLPAFAGADGYGDAVTYGVKLTGATVHLVSAGLDDGPIIAQESIVVDDFDTKQTLAERGLALEHRLYPKTLHRLLTEEWHVSCGPAQDGRARVVFGTKGGHK